MNGKLQPEFKIAIEIIFSKFLTDSKSAMDFKACEEFLHKIHVNEKLLSKRDVALEFSLKQNDKEEKSKPLCIDLQMFKDYYIRKAKSQPDEVKQDLKTFGIDIEKIQGFITKNRRPKQSKRDQKRKIASQHETRSWAEVRHARDLENYLASF